MASTQQNQQNQQECFKSIKYFYKSINHVAMDNDITYSIDNSTFSIIVTGKIVDLSNLNFPVLSNYHLTSHPNDETIQFILADSKGNNRIDLSSNANSLFKIKIHVSNSDSSKPKIFNFDKNDVSQLLKIADSIKQYTYDNSSIISLTIKYC
jgi:hypothetical protein